MNPAVRQILVCGSAHDPREHVPQVKIFYVKDKAEDFVIIGHRGQTWGEVSCYITEQLEPDGFHVTRVDSVRPD